MERIWIEYTGLRFAIDKFEKINSRTYTIWADDTLIGSINFNECRLKYTPRTKYENQTKYYKVIEK